MPSLIDHFIIVYKQPLKSLNFYSAICLFACLITLTVSLLFLGRTAQALESINICITTPTGTIYGTQLLPIAKKTEPVVLMIAGSGSTDRNGNNPSNSLQNNSLKLLAEGLATHGIASVRYDKRGIGASASAAPKEIDLRFETYVEDAAQWLQKLKADSRFSTVTAIGHSEGSLVGMLAVQKTGANAFISIAGPARTASDLLREQLRPRLPNALWQESERILTALRQGNLATPVPPELNAIYRLSVQPYLISWFRYTPAQEIKRLTVPVLIIQGTTDIQVPMSEAQALHAAKPEAKLRIIEGMNHILKAVSLDPKQQTASSSNPKLPIVPALIEAIEQFIGELVSPR